MATGFNVTLISFTTGANILPADVNTNFVNLNAATIYTGTVSTLSSDGGSLRSNSTGGLFTGGQLGVTTYGDRFDAVSQPGSLLLGAGTITPGSVGSGSGTFAFVITGTTYATISAAGLATGTNGVMQFSTGSIARTASFTGISSGIYNHGLGDTPQFAFASHNSTTLGSGGTYSPAQSTIGVNMFASGPFVCWLITYN